MKTTGKKATTKKSAILKKNIHLIRNACTDSFRAIVLHPTWEKPYYRCAQAWHQLGETSHAAEINRLGQLLCSSSSDLQSQISDFGLSESIR